jgi:hypothetical protein
MPQFKDLPTELQAKVKTLEAIAEKDRQEAKAHEYYMEFRKNEVICGALTGSGKVCIRAPYIKEDGSTNGKCYAHGGKSTGARTEEGKKKAIKNLRARTPVHGLYSKNFLETLSEEELAFMQWMEDSVKARYEIETALEETSLQMLIMEAVRHFRMVNTKFEKETKHASEYLTKFLRIIETQGWRKKDENEEKRKGVSVDTILNMLNELDSKNKSEKQPQERAQIKRIK